VKNKDVVLQRILETWSLRVPAISTTSGWIREWGSLLDGRVKNPLCEAEVNGFEQAQMM
jgi:hypothetical protein